MTETGQQPHTQRGDWWSRRPRRSRSNSKIAGVAGGLGNYLGVDPILFRVGFVALTVLGGAGILAYCLLWLLLPADGDEVSAGESLIGRGRSSVSPVLAVGLAIAVLISITSSFSWGLPFWPVVVVALIAFHIARKQRRGPFRPGSDWEQRFRNTQQAFTSNQWSDGNGQPGPQGPGPGWHSQRRHGPGWGSSNWSGWGCGPQTKSGGQEPAPTAGAAGHDDAPSPFDTPAFWDGPTGPSSQTGPGSTPAGSSASGFAGHTPTPFPPAPFSTGTPSTGSTAAPGSPPASGGSSPEASFAPARTTPPDWDPLGAAPFAWDLPDIDLAPQSSQTLVKARSASPVIARATMGIAVLTIAVQILGIIAGWWAMNWATVAGTALAIVAFGLLLQALRGRSITLVGPGVLLSVATVALALTGLTGMASIGDRNWATPTTAAMVQGSYHLSAGDARLDLSDLKLTEGQTVTTSLAVNAGQATVIVPAGVNLNVTCSANVGNLDCLGNTDDGIDVDQTFVDTNPEFSGTLNLDVHVGAGNVQVIR